MVKSLNFDGIEVEYDDSQLNKWSVQKQLATAGGQFEAMDKILCGKSDEVAEKLGDEAPRMTELLQRIATVENLTAKN